MGSTQHLLVMDNAYNYGIEGYKAPDLMVDQWVGTDDKPISPISLNDYNDTLKVIYCFQSWCPGCHSRGFPSLQQLTEELAGNEKVVFLAIQTVFEGHEENTYDKMLAAKKEYGLHIPFGHDPGSESSNNRSKTMYHYRTGGTPWFIFIDQQNNVVFNDYHLNVENAIKYLKTIT